MRKRIRLLSVIVAVALAAIAFGPGAGNVDAAGNTCYVSPGGDNSNPGTLEFPWADPGYASRQIESGDTLVILGGTYHLNQYDADIISPPSGAPGAWTTVRGEEGNRPVLAGGGNLIFAIDLSGRSYVSVENLEITSDGGAPFREAVNATGGPLNQCLLKDLYIHHVDEFGVDIADTRYLEIADCVIEYCGFGSVGGPDGVQGGWRDVVIRGCELSYSGHYYQGGPGPSPYARPDGFGIEESLGPIEIVSTTAKHNRGDGLDSKASNTNIHECVVANNSCDGVKLWGGGSRLENTLIYGTGDGVGGASPWAGLVISDGDNPGARFEVVNVTIHDNPEREAYPMYVQYDYDVPIQVLMRNCIVANGYGLVFFGDSVTLTADHSIFYRPGGQPQVYANGREYSPADIDGGVLGEGNVCADPLFESPAWGSEGDYHLGEGSPAIDSGTGEGAPGADLDGGARPAGDGYDMGAYESRDHAPPADPVKLVFIHHSCGENWLNDANGGLGIALRDNNYFVSDTYYGWGPGSIGDTTDIGHWYAWFRGPSSSTYLAALYSESGQHSAYSRLTPDPGGENEIVMFKSCYPNSDLKGDPGDPVPPIGSNPLRGQDCSSAHHTVANAKGIYTDLLEYFSTRQDKLFIVVTAPPRSSGTYASNARHFNNWLVNDWLDSYPYDNVYVLDFYNVLTSNGGNPNVNDLDWETGNHHRWWEGAVQHKTDYGSDTLAYATGDDHPSGAGNWKATGELVDLINVAYNDFNNDAPTVTSITPSSGTNDGTVDITDLAGTNLGSGATVKLERTGEADINGTSVNVVSPTRITCDFDLTGATTGDWDVYVENTDGQSATLAGGFTVEEPPLPPPTVTSITPSSGTNDGTVDITDLAGTNLGSGATVKLERTGEADINGTSVNVVSPTRITCDFDLTGATTGDWDVYVENTDGQSATLAGGFTVEEPKAYSDTWYLAEGSSDWGFDTYITIANPNETDVTARITYLTKVGPVERPGVVLPALSQTVINPREDIGATDFSTKVECAEGRTIAVDRRMIWTGDGAPSPDGHCSIGVTSPAKTWYLPEGSSDWGFECWLLIQNPNANEANVTVTYMIEGEGPQSFTKTIPANSRESYNMADDIGAKDASIKVESDVPVIAERAMYRNNRRSGHASIGTTSPALSCFLAEGTTDWGFTTYVLIQNPNPTDTEVDVTYMTNSGPVPQATFTIPADSRKTIRVNDVLPDTDLSTKVTGSQPIIAERAMYWDNGTGEACHDSIGMASPHTTFYLPDGETGGGYETYTLVQNPNDTDVEVEISYLTEGGTGNQTFTETIAANSRMTYSMVDKGINGRASVMVTCKTPGRRIMVERAMYWNGRGAGTDTIGGYSD